MKSLQQELDECLNKSEQAMGRKFDERDRLIFAGLFFAGVSAVYSRLLILGQGSESDGIREMESIGLQIMSFAHSISGSKPSDPMRN